MIVLKAERQALILNYIDQSDFVSLEDLMKRLDASESTVRRDLDDLAGEGLLKRVHGGAKSLKFDRTELSNLEKLHLNKSEKEVIAQAASQLIEDNDFIFIDPGSTTQLLIEALDAKDIKVVTNSVQHATQLIKKGIETWIIGGSIKPKTDAAIGPFALEQLKQLRFDKVFIGANAVNLQGIWTPDPFEAQIKQVLCQSADQVFVLADASKFNQQSYAKIYSLDSIQVITNKERVTNMEAYKKKVQVIEV